MFICKPKFHYHTLRLCYTEQDHFQKLNNLVEIQPTVTPSEPRQSFVDKIHGITDKLQSLGHIGHDSSSDAKGKSGETLTV